METIVIDTPSTRAKTVFDFYKIFKEEKDEKKLEAAKKEALALLMDLARQKEERRKQMIELCKQMSAQHTK